METADKQKIEIKLLNDWIDEIRLLSHKNPSLVSTALSNVVTRNLIKRGLSDE